MTNNPVVEELKIALTLKGFIIGLILLCGIETWKKM